MSEGGKKFDRGPKIFFHRVDGFCAALKIVGGSNFRALREFCFLGNHGFLGSFMIFLGMSMRRALSSCMMFFFLAFFGTISATFGQ